MALRRFLMLDSGGAMSRFAYACAIHLALAQSPALQYHCSQKEITEGATYLTNGELPEGVISEWLFTYGEVEHSVYIGPAFDVEAKVEIQFNTDFSKPAFKYDLLWCEAELAYAYSSAAGLLLIASHEQLESTAKLLSCVFGQIRPPTLSAVLLPDENVLLKQIFANHTDYNRTQYILPQALSHRDGSMVGLEENNLITKELAGNSGFTTINTALGSCLTTSPAWFYSSVYKAPESGRTQGVPDLVTPYENAFLWLLQQANTPLGK